MNLVEEIGKISVEKLYQQGYLMVSEMREK